MPPKIILFIVTVILLTTSQTSLADDNGWKSNTWVMPEYCRDWLDPNGRWMKWQAKFRSMKPHMSHYCSGIYAEIKAKSTINKRERDKWLSNTASEMAYTSRHCDSTCVVYGDLHRRWAWALGEQGKVAEAMEHRRLSNTVAAGTP